MTTTPATTDHDMPPLDAGYDVLDALVKSVTPAPWGDEYSETHEVWIVFDANGDKVAEAFDSATAALIAAARNALPALLDELATERRQSAAMASITGEAIRQIGEERDAAREELAKTRAELAATHTELDRLRGVIREGVDMAEWHRNEITTWKRKAARLREQLGNAKARISAAATVEVWTNEDGKRFVFADDLMAALDPNPEASPATTAEPAAKPKATIRTALGDDWSQLLNDDAEPAAS